jgi:hypothetical protein
MTVIQSLTNEQLFHFLNKLNSAYLNLKYEDPVAMLIAGVIADLCEEIENRGIWL